MCACASLGSFEGGAAIKAREIDLGWMIYIHHFFQDFTPLVGLPGLPHMVRLDAMSAAVETGMKEIVRLSQAREQMERRMRGRRSSSSLPAAIDLILARPTVSASMVAKAAEVTPRGALNLIAELGVREATGRGRYRAWAVF